MEQAQNKHDVSESYLNRIKIGAKSKEQRDLLANINKLYNARNMVIKLFKDHSSMIFEAREKAVKEEELK